MAESRSMQPTNTPVRPQASPRPSPPFSPTFSASSDFHPSIDELEDELLTHSSGVQSPLRGRTLHRIPAKSRLVSRAITRRHTELFSADLEWRKRAKTHDLINTLTEYDHSLLEPLPFERFRSSLSEELHRASTFDSSVDISKFAGHTDTFAVLGLRRLQHRGPKLPPMLFAQIAPYLDFDTYKAIRLTCHSWSVAISDARPIKLPPVMMLPAEILEKIYIELSPVDFNAARRTCRAWMITSLEESLLMTMVKRGGWSGAVSADKEVKAEEDLEYRTGAISENWLLSKRLATECSLGPGWLGNGLSNVQTTTTGLQLTSEVDFSQLGAGPVDPNDNKSRRITHFTVSTCSRYLLVFQSCTIYVYALAGFSADGHVQPYGGHLELSTILVCPAHVLAVSMDSSSQRYAVAALLHGSIGMVCDADLTSFCAPRHHLNSSRSRSLAYDEGQGSVFAPPRSDELVARNPTVYTYATFGTIFGASSDHYQARTIAEVTLPEVQGAFRTSRVWDAGESIEKPLIGRTASYACPSVNTRTRDGPRTTYRNLCSAEDPPRSVAICPQRRCVAFGCRKGIELHWVDALTGQDLTRWFPMPAPSDFLFFMPSREGVDRSTRRLRLISSAIHPGAVREMPGTYPTYSDHTSDFEQRVYDSRKLASEARSAHYRAVPLSDGYHVVFMLPGSRELYVGQEGPAGPSSRKLTKCFVFVGPKDEHGTTIIPGQYASASELRWGLRVAVAYGDQLWFFVIPPDLLFKNRIARKKAGASNLIEDNSNPPVQVAGVIIATIVGIESMAFDASAGDLTLWAFSRDAKAYVFQLAGSSSKTVTQRTAMSDGTIVLTRDVDGDSVMIDAHYPPEDLGLRIDGAASLNQDRLSSLVPCFPSCIHIYCNRLLDAACSTLMTDIDGSPTNQDVQFHATSVHHDSPSSLAPCFLACGHKYCKLLLYADNSTLMTSSTTPPCLPSTVSNTDTNASMSPSSPASLKDPPFPPAFTPSPEDEGYASAGDEEFEMAGGHSAIYVPPLSARWSEDDAEWVPEYLRVNSPGTEDVGLGPDLLALCRCECEIVGH